VQTSTQYTIGTALARAHDAGQSVEVLVEGHWLSGRIVGTDGQGVVLEEGADHCVVRLERVTAVRVRRLDAAAGSPGGVVTEDDDAIPMPGPVGAMADPRQTTLVADVA
jgi:hypothetical protein